jgi:hypothetical protein
VHRPHTLPPPARRAPAHGAPHAEPRTPALSPHSDPPPRGATPRLTRASAAPPRRTCPSPSTRLRARRSARSR